MWDAAADPTLCPFRRNSLLFGTKARPVHHGLKLRTWWVRITIVAAVLGVGLVAWKLRYHVMLKNVRVVEAGRIYRGGLQQPGPLRRLVRDYHIRTILSLRGPCDGEEAIARSMGVEWISIDMDEGLENGIDDELEAAAAVLADRSKQPVYFHCSSGRNRSNMIHAAYRMIVCGWSVEQAIAELERLDFNPDSDPDDARRREQLITFYRDRVPADRTAQARPNDLPPDQAPEQGTTLR